MTHSRGLDRRAVVGGLAGIVGAAFGLGGCTSEGEGASTGAADSTATPAGGSARESTQQLAPPPPTTAAASAAATPAVLQQDGPDITTGPTGGRSVALTFHGAGDLALASRVLDIAKRSGASITVFAVGQWLMAAPSIGRAIVAAGHDLGNHTWSHQPMPSLSPTDAAREVARGAQAVAASVGTAGLLFRPSGTPSSTATIRSAAASAGYHRCISYDVDPADYADPGRDAVVSRTLAAVTDGSIVSLHLGHQGTVDALPAILAGLAARSLRPVRLTDLLRTAS